MPSEPTGPAFHYDADPAKLESEGIILVTSTGRAGTETRSLQVGVGRGGSADFLYYTDHEDGDPDNVQAYPSGMDSAVRSVLVGGQSADRAAGTAPRSPSSAATSSTARCTPTTRRS